jgi:hypothetical protein
MKKSKVTHFGATEQVILPCWVLWSGAKVQWYCLGRVLDKNESCDEWSWVFEQVGLFNCAKAMVAGKTKLQRIQETLFLWFLKRVITLYEEVSKRV